MSRSTATATQSGSRKKATKAVVAGAIGIALLAGGGGSFARWYDSETIASGGTITNGALSLEKVAGTGNWTFNNVALAEGTVVTDLSIVPGDVLEYTEAVAVAADGDALAATLTTTAGTATSTFEGLIVEQTFTEDSAGVVDGVAGVPITAENDGDTFTVTVTITFPEFKDAAAAEAEGAAAHAGWWNLDGQKAELELSDITVVLEQNDRV